MIIIRKFKLTDLDQIIQLFYETVHTINIKDYSQEQVDVWAPKNQDTTKWEKSLSDHISYVVEIDNKIVGFGDITNEGYLDHLYTHKDFQGRGISSAILKKLEEETKKLGLSEITTEASITAQPFFEKHGYKTITEQTKIVRGISFLNYKMKKNL
jgi:putative acetyltransferase